MPDDLAVFLLKQTIAGALRGGEVLVRVVDAVAGDDVDEVLVRRHASELVMLCGKTPSWLIMSTFQTSFGGSPVFSGEMSKHTTSQRLVG